MDKSLSISSGRPALGLLREFVQLRQGSAHVASANLLLAVALGGIAAILLGSFALLGQYFVLVGQITLPVALSTLSINLATGSAFILAGTGLYLQCVVAGKRPGWCRITPLFAVAIIVLSLSSFVALLVPLPVAFISALMPVDLALAFGLTGFCLLLTSGAACKTYPAAYNLWRNLGRDSGQDSVEASYIYQLRNMVQHIENLREKDKKEMARELHDEVGGLLTSLAMQLEGIYSLLPKDAPWPDRKAKIQLLVQSLVKISRRMQAQLHPAMLELFGLSAALKEQLDNFTEQTGVATSMSLPDEEVHFDRALEIAVYRMLQEYLSTVIQYVQAQHVDVILDVDSDQLVMTIRDNGTGLADRQHHVTVMALRERAIYLGGSAKFNVSQSPLTALVIMLPLKHDM